MNILYVQDNEFNDCTPCSPSHTSLSFSMVWNSFCDRSSSPIGKRFFLLRFLNLSAFLGPWSYSMEDRTGRERRQGAEE